MDEDKMAESTNTPNDQEIKTEPKETGRASPDFIPFSTPKPFNDINSVPSQEKVVGLEKNGQKRIKSEQNDVSSKKPRTSTSKVPGITKEGGNQIGHASDTEEYYLTISNLPTDWTYVQIMNYLVNECGPVDEMEMIEQKDLKHAAIKLTFQSPEKCIQVYKRLENNVIEQNKLEVKISDIYTTFPTGVTVSSSLLESDENVGVPVRSWRPDQDVWETDPAGLYGLRPQFLASLNIKPPLNRMVHVTNFRCDKNELKEVMEMAGNVLMCCVVATLQRYAKVMYSHPLEAVQAISMLNGQMYYGVPLRISMDTNPTDSIVLPKGLANIGLGLGLRGIPIRNIAHQYQRFAKNQSSLINPIVFSKIDSTDTNAETEENSDEILNKINAFMSSVPRCNIINPTIKTKNIDELDSNDSNSKDGSDRSTPETHISKASVASRKTSAGSVSPNRDPLTKNVAGKPQNNIPIVATPALNAATPNPLVRLGAHGNGFIHPNQLLNPPVPMHNPMPGPGGYRPNNLQERPRHFLPRAVPFIPRPAMQRPPFPSQPMPAFGPAPGMRPQIPPANFSGPRPNIGNGLTVKFANLPPSTTFPLLCDQLAQCGQVMSVQLTTPGCAVATFGHPSHANRCMQTFNGMNVEGYIIEVSYA